MKTSKILYWITVIGMMIISTLFSREIFNSFLSKTETFLVTISIIIMIWIIFERRGK